ncbi:DNA methyltransferase [Sideroxydans sp. CL21]|uniref:class I SAM-dependent DNA methyltransferase n=1 Tax=Sideroxydans sp. CL21 TaxID=2600596 RepID=UPI0024BC00EB|nr:DNA methyltransferase [Sideroxydans sp. CL21]
MTPHQFIQKWKDSQLGERASYQIHFSDLCALVGVPAPSPDSKETYCYERGATRTGAGRGWADVWKQGHFAFEYKARDRNLGDALKQLMTYALALENPPLLVVCDTNIIQIHTHFTNAPSEVHTIALQDIGERSNLEKLRWLFTDPDKFHPKRTITQITEEAAGKFAALAQSLNTRGHDSQTVAHFLNQCLFCLFAEDAGLLPEKLFERLLDKSQTDPAKLTLRLEELFSAMRKGGDFALEDIHWFNGGLFEKINVLPITTTEIKMLHEAAKLDWSGIEPSIFGTLFERGLDPGKRSQLGAHYTDPQSILRIINPVIVEPLAKEWETARAEIAEKIAKRKKSGDKAERDAQAVFTTYLDRLQAFRVLDPACGSGNFLYVALRVLKDLEHKANLDAEALGLHRQINIEVSPANVLGIELNSYAAELARVTVWIGEIQWMLKNGYPIRKNPILQPLDHIEHRDAVMNLDGSEAEWPCVDAIIGNPPFLGGSKMRSELSDDYTEALRKCYADRVPGGADLVVYWFEKARAQIEAGKCNRAGLVSTNSIRGGANRKVLDKILDTSQIFNAWSDEEWINEGAAVRVSLVCFETKQRRYSLMLDGMAVGAIYADLTGMIPATVNSSVGSPLRTFVGVYNDLTKSKQLQENVGICFMGASKKAPFDIPGQLARQWLKQPNPNGKPNSEVLRPLCNAMNITRRPSDVWIIDFGTDMNEKDAALYEIPFAYVVEHVKPISEKNRDQGVARNWWRHARPRIEMRHALASLKRFIATPAVSKHRLFVFLDASVLPDQATLAIARDDDTTFGILHSRFHELWALRTCTWMGAGNDPRYTPTTTFETFPFPEGLTPNLPPADYTNTAATEIATNSQKLNELRDNWLNPSEWVEWMRTLEEEKAEYPLRPFAKIGHEAELNKRTLTNLYNARPAWLDNAHKTLDQAVAKAYGWNDYTPEMTNDEILRRLLAMNLERVQ